VPFPLPETTDTAKAGAELGNPIGSARAHSFKVLAQLRGVSLAVNELALDTYGGAWPNCAPLASGPRPITAAPNKNTTNANDPIACA
jgi:hypothetical protein